MRNNTPWPDMHIEALKQNFAAGLSFAEIAAAINAKFGTSYSRSGCIGKSNRIGLTQAGRSTIKREKPDAGPKPWETSGTSRSTWFRQRANEGKPRPAPQQFGCDAVTGLRIADITPIGLTIHDLSDQTCRWPYGERPPYLYCGHPIFAGGSWCEAHAALAQGRGTESERSAHRGLAA